MSKATNGSKVKVHYTGRLEDGTVFDSSANREPLEFTVGGGQMIKGFDVAVNGMTIGDKKSVNIPSAEAYGEARADMILDVPREQVPADITPEVGMQLSLSQPDGQQVPVVITHVDDAKITLDANHPLAGKDLIFDIELVSMD